MMRHGGQATRNRSRRLAGGSGFLLVEALAAMAIGAFILIALVSVVSLMTRAGERAAGLSSGVEATSRAMDAIARDLTVAARTRWAGGGAAFVFSGTPTSLVFARRYGEYGDLRLIALSSEDRPRPRLLRSEAPLPPDATGPADVVSGALAEVYDGPLSVRFSYFSRLPTGEEALLDSWAVGSEMPSGVRVALFDPASGDIAAARRISLMIDAEPGCAAPSTALCSYVENGEADAVGAADLPPEPVDPNDPRGWMSYAR